MLHQAAECLGTAECVIYPASDGGYVLLGLTRDAPGLFSAMPWSTDGVAAETMRRCEALGITVRVGPTLHDVDGPEDLGYLPRSWLAAIADSSRGDNKR